MKTTQAKVEAHIRGLFPELMFTSVCRKSKENPTGVRKSYKKTSLAHYLRALGIEYMVDGDGNVWKWNEATDRTNLVPLVFDLVKQEPKNEKDWTKLAEILGVNLD